MHIKIFTTGGSLDKGYSTRESAFVVQDTRVGELLQEANPGFTYEIESLLKKDSLEITENDRELVARRVEEEGCSRILITHGTDTMAMTGRRLSSIPGKTIVLTGAMQPATFKSSDAQFNLGFNYLRGWGVEQDQTAAVEWIRRAADQGYGEAQSHLGYLYANGIGVEKDYGQAAAWYRRAADSEQ